MEYIRKCPKCGKNVISKGKYARNNFLKAIRKKTVCYSCSMKLRSKKYTGKNNPFYGKRHSKKVIEKLKVPSAHCKTKWFRELRRKQTTGKNNPMYGKNWYDFWVKKYGVKEAKVKLKKHKERKSIASSGKNNSMYGRPSPEGSGNGWSGWYKGWFFRSIKELSYMINIIEKNHLIWESAETKELSIKYIDYKGDERTYRADFLINNNVLVEIKPRKLENSISVLCKKKAAINFCKKKKLKYKIVFDPKLLSTEEMKKLYFTNQIKFLPRYEEMFKKKYLIKI